MGQRHQIFVRIANPAKFCDKGLKKALTAEFGKADTTILAFHHQWLYGRSALQAALSLLNFGAQISKDDKATTKGYGYDLPISPVYMKNQSNFGGYNKIKDFIAFILNFRPVNTAWNSAGLGTAFYIGDTDKGIREDFTLGDNNDGITIIDLIENKYCFMSISNYRSIEDGLGFDADDLPYLKPSTAREYVATYYGETLETTNPSYLMDKKDREKFLPIEKQNKVVADNIKTNTGLAKGFDKFGLLTVADLRKMFPKMQQLRKEKKPKAPKKALFAYTVTENN